MKLKALIVEDSEEDAVLLQDALRRGGYELDCRRVETAADLAAALADEPWDIVLSDYVMPTFDAPAALRELQQSGKAIPFIIISGEIGEMLAVESLKLGADDYLLKHNMRRLIPSVKRALEDAEIRRQRDKARHMNELMMANSLDMICTLDEQLRFVEVSAASSRILGLAPGELAGQPVAEFLHPDDREQFPVQAEEIMAGHSILDWQNRCQRTDGTVVQLMWSAHWSAHDRLFFCVARDVTDLKRTEEELKLFRSLVDQSDDIFEVIDPETGRFLDVSHRGCLTLGYSREELLGLTVFDIKPTTKRALWPDLVQNVRKHGHVQREGVHRRKNGSTFPVEVSVKLALQDREYLVVVARDITARKQSEERIREQAELLDKASDAIMVHDLSGHIQYWNLGAERILGWTKEEAVGALAADLGNKDTFTGWRARDAVLNKGEWSGEIRMTSKSGQEVTMQSRWTRLLYPDGAFKAILSINSDVTEKKKLEAQFLQAQRLESIGMLASGIAHDLNNVLSPIALSLGLLREALPDEEDVQLIDNLESGTKRASGIVNQVLAFGRGVRGERVPVNLGRLVKEVRKLLENTFPKSIQLDTRSPSDLWSVTGDPNQLHQVLLNLCVNARDAMPKGGLLRLSVNNLILDETHMACTAEGAHGAYVELAVMDSGCGMPAHVREQIFEPFFTTKDVGKGTGLGLSSVSAIVKSHGGFINVESEIDKGSTFQVYLPATSEPAEEYVRLKADQLPRGNGETILVIDDEVVLLQVTERVLRRYGYKPITARDGAAGVAAYAQHRDAINLVLTNMTMPILDGVATIHAILSLNPQARIVAVTGCSLESDVIKEVEDMICFCLQKPYSNDSLLLLLQKLLDKRHEDFDPTV